MDYTVSRDVRTLVALHEGTDTTACAEAADETAETLESLVEAEENGVSTWENLDAEVYEHPAAPFDPYTIAVSFRLFVAVSAESQAAAEELGTERLEEILDDFESVSYPSPATASER